MNIKAIIPTGHTEITVNGLHQWDYGRKLEIHSNDLPAVVEVHFACVGMTEAVVRSCQAADGVAVAAIPDKCLEQTAPITAWVYEIDGTTGVTTVKITLPIEPRTRPCACEDIPEDISDKYTEAVTAMNAAVKNISTGQVKVAAATKADLATKATEADQAAKATQATQATKATQADKATLAADLSITALASGTNLNNVTSPGRYSLVADDSYTNAIMANTVRYLDVIKQGSYIWQILTGSAYQGSSWHPFRTYKRCYSINSTAGESSTYGWTSWYEEINTHNFGKQSITATSIKPTLAKSVTVSGNLAEHCELPLETKKIYLVVLRYTHLGENRVNTGVLLYSANSETHYITAGTHSIKLGTSDEGMREIDVTELGGSTTTGPYTVEFYKLGSI
jgi:hypothetical protein